ncbi:MAG: hypothetical protein QM811_08780 [Pirellulales bacterium]
MNVELASSGRTWFPTYRRWLGIRPHPQVVLAESALPESIRQTILSVVQRTRLWRGERYDVTREFIAHFADGLDAGRTPEELLAAFGDPKQAAKLIRAGQTSLPPAVVAWAALGDVGVGRVAGRLCVCDRVSVVPDARRDDRLLDHLPRTGRSVVRGPESLAAVSPGVDST